MSDPRPIPISCDTRNRLRQQLRELSRSNHAMIDELLSILNEDKEVAAKTEQERQANEAGH